jgi:outer membrane lipopolysaccharide assembly protein LptE/RlpB
MKRWIMLSLFIAMVLLPVGCGSFLREAVGMQNTPQCEQMEQACREARELRRENRRTGVKNGADIRLKDVQRRCEQCMADCNRSQRPEQDFHAH